MRIHIVQKGDTLWKLAEKYEVDYEHLKEANPNLTNPEMLMPGMKVKVPAGSVAVRKEQKKTTPKAKEVDKKQQKAKEQSVKPPKKPELKASEKTQAANVAPAPPYYGQTQQGVAKPPEYPPLPPKPPCTPCQGNAFQEFAPQANMYQQSYAPNQQLYSQQMNQPPSYQPQANQPQSYPPQSYQPQANQPQSYQPQSYQPQANQPQSYQPQIFQPQAYGENAQLQAQSHGPKQQESAGKHQPLPQDKKDNEAGEWNGVQPQAHKGSSKSGIHGQQSPWGSNAPFVQQSGGPNQQSYPIQENQNKGFQGQQNTNFTPWPQQENKGWNQEQAYAHQVEMNWGQSNGAQPFSQQMDINWGQYRYSPYQGEIGDAAPFQSYPGWQPAALPQMPVANSYPPPQTPFFAPGTLNQQAGPYRQPPVGQLDDQLYQQPHYMNQAPSFLTGPYAAQPQQWAHPQSPYLQEQEYEPEEQINAYEEEDQQD
ncbi:SafA/ExsA family spore coat assembly protein [Shouchella clausii]|uniref:SafA/ExsA family spore coat assembly protein n=1 Tax=Shouchella TaxID=2893057 RepID=UPI000BA1A184|nr:MULTISPECIES: SafA/ExsA family spore coat assembly protein [Shouchella]MDP0464355.1 SafA/ExsA family spore coat assembly protein [Shouchella rhizosphaerae]MDP5258153.1 SafA/ExsA family spore coat assembly protein [Shouchella clausii]MDP5265938.1 SafA/ExsA family spore coat assembly protein [Shouchella clausii]MDP5283713.1 SafA/ExsA family spore coat assembly protein [Shouchella clausii]MDP5303518.1 SafA/ExsA family spore coat assembly protein [Shouchella clausii]